MVNYQELEFYIDNARFKFTVESTASNPSRSKSHIHTNFELFFVWDGEVTIQTESQQYFVTKNQAMLLAPTQYHQSSTKDHTKKLNLYFSFVHTGKQTSSNNMYQEFNRVFSQVSAAKIDTATEIGNYVSLFQKTFASDCFGKRERLNSILKGFIFSLYDALNRQVINGSCSGSVSNIGINYSYKIDHLIAQNFMKNIDLNFLAEELCLSPKRVAVIVKSLYGKSFRELKTEMKIQFAKQLLRESDLTVSEIAAKVGYDSTRGFLSAFSKITNTTPSKYRQTHVV